MTVIDISNRDQATIDGFGEEWSRFDQSALPAMELARHFEAYFKVFRWDLVNKQSIGFDMGCGSGRWASLLAPRVGRLHCIDASPKALAVARRTLRAIPNIVFHNAGVDDVPLAPASMDFGVSLGVLHHLPDTAAAIKSCARLLKPGAPLLLYLYYRFDNRPAWFRALWAASDLLRRLVCVMPLGLKLAFTQTIATLIYWPLARLALGLERLGLNVAQLPLTAYRNASYYTMKTDALDRFGTRVEHRFNREEIETMLIQAGCREIVFSDAMPFWSVCAVKE